MSLTALLDPAVHLAYLAVTQLAATLPGAVSPGDRTALAVVLVTWAVRAGLLPLALSAARARVASAGLAPEISRLQRRYAGDPARLGQELRRVYREAGTGPFAAIGPMLAQLPVISTMYRLVVVPVVAGAPNVVLTAVALGVPLGGHWPALLGAAGVFSGTALVLLALLCLLAGLAWISSRQAAAATTAAAPRGASPAPQIPGAAARLARLLPFATVGFAVVAPPAVGIYLLASTAWAVTERALLPG
jgi:YidC/Oxa1 family membrane protein insertase